MHEEEAATLYLTDFLVRHFDRFVMRYFGLDLYPELLPDIFGNFKRAIYLVQIPNQDMEKRAHDAARRLGLPLEVRVTGLGGVTRFLSRDAAR
jgi:hypothetical protein